MKKLFITFCLLGFATFFVSAQNIPNVKTSDSNSNYVNSKNTRAVLWDQSAIGTKAYSSQDFGAGFETYSNQAADDFVVVGNWVIDSLTCSGKYTTSGPLNVVNVIFYADSSGFPGDTIAELFNVPCVTESSGLVKISLPSEVVLSDGIYWVSIVAVMDFSVAGGWEWYESTTSKGSLWAWRNPGNAYQSGFTINWGTGQAALAATGHDLTLGIYGKISSTGINDMNTNVSLSPNPTSDLLEITTTENYLITVFDITGKVIVSTQTVDNFAVISLSEQNAGIYFVNLKNNDKNATYKVVKN
ncbi:MAG: T9SS type A sorting domain-containing protein [Candidatus Cloacimonetes bacterium]|nr:T9SS type A sorting domain-containing protein [Candidatus Cloacimonadota bacterium]MDY0230561.1 T9SS type A sorting domain-containing protein [Candidatus Cloacimonadaceae bacterium]